MHQLLTHLPLPAEVRERIYKMVLSTDFESVLLSHYSASLHLSLLLVSRRTYEEAYHIFYSNNLLQFSSTALLFTFLRNVGHTRRQCVTRIAFTLCGGFAEQAFALLKTCQSLKFVRITLPDVLITAYTALCEVRGLDEVDIQLVSCPYPQGNPPCYCMLDPKYAFQELREAMMRPRLEPATLGAAYDASKDLASYQ